jgi:hypothetical protein
MEWNQVDAPLVDAILYKWGIINYLFHKIIIKKIILKKNLFF